MRWANEIRVILNGCELQEVFGLFCSLVEHCIHFLINIINDENNIDVDDEIT